MKSCFKFLPLFGLLAAVPAFAADAPVTVTENSAFYSLDNGIVTAVVSKNSGDLVSLKYHGTQMLGSMTGDDGQIDFSRDYPGDPGRGRGMTDHMYGFWSHDAVAPRSESKVTIDPKANGGERVEVSVKGYSDGQNLGHGPGAPANGAFAADIEIRYALGRGDSGVYTYCTFDHKPAYPDATMNEARYCVKLSNIFDYMLVDDLRHGVYPLEKERDGDDKYNYTTDQFDHPAFGWASSSDKVGCFFINASTEYLSGGPTKVEFVCHRDTSPPNYAPTILNYWRSSHYGGSSADAAQGEEWTKVIGPFMIYCNSGGDPLALWKDAIAQQKKEAAKWPYDWVNGVDYPHKDQRATVSGRLVLTDPLMPGAKMSNVRVGLTFPNYHITTSRGVTDSNTPADITWMTDAKHYEFWARGSDDGQFAIPNVRAGSYTLHAIADGVLGEFAQANVTVEAGKPLDLGKLVWTPVRHGRQVWDIGIPNRNGTEFAKGDDYFHDGMALVYRDMFPNDVNYVIGKSDFHKDWYFQHVPHVEDPNARPNSIMGGGASSGRADPWKISWDMPTAPKGTATLRVAIAGGSVTGGRIPVEVNGQQVDPIRVAGDSTVGRNGIQGLWYEREVVFPASLLKAGTNTLTLTVPAGGQTNGVIYDYLRLELDENAQPTAAQ
ncbi:MAG TPA: polysaccharide lyase family 4 protein [Opitutales bacterium]|nr:polysaccharide lyase family 4 protein [Opitutales bacterium]